MVSEFKCLLVSHCNVTPPALRDTITGSFVNKLLTYVVKWQINAQLFQKLLQEDNFNILKILYEGHLESKERFAIKKYLLIIGKKKNMQVLSHTFTYFST